MSPAPDCAVIGAGAAGLAAAQTLQAAGRGVVVFDKGRRPGGRLASRDTAFGSFDHGAQFLRLRDPFWIRAAARWQAAGALAPWPEHDAADGTQAWTGQPEMNALARFWAQGQDVRCSHTLREIHRHPGSYELRFDDGSRAGPFAQVLVTAPAPQALAWLGDGPLGAVLRQAVYAPSIALMWAPGAHALPPRTPRALEADSGLALIAREDLKPGRGGVPRYLVQASAEWSAEHLDQPEADLCRHLRGLAARVLEVPADGEHVQVHRWRYARVTRALDRDALEDGAGCFYAGDACLGGRVEAALRSGHAAALRMLAARRP